MKESLLDIAANTKIENNALKGDEKVMMDKLLAVILFSLENMETEVMSAAYLALITMKKIPPNNIAFKAFENANLIDKDGKTVVDEDLLLIQLGEVLRPNKRCEPGRAEGGGE